MTESGKKTDNESTAPNFFFSLGMQKDQRYEFARMQIELGKITEFNQIFKFVPKTVVAGDLGIARVSFNKRLNKVEKFTFEDVIAIGRFLGLEDMMPSYKMVHLQYIAQKKKKKK